MQGTHHILFLSSEAIDSSADDKISFKVSSEKLPIEYRVQYDLWFLVNSTLTNGVFDTGGIVSPTISEIGSSSLFLNMTRGSMNFKVLWVGELIA